MNTKPSPFVQRLLDSDGPAKSGEMKPPAIGEAFFTAGEKLNVFVPVYFSSRLKENQGVDTLSYLRSIEDSTGNGLVDDVKRYAARSEDEYKYNENNYTEEDYEDAKSRGLEGADLEPFEGPWNLDEDGESADPDADPDDIDAAFDNYLEQEYGGRWDKFAEQYESDHDDARHFPDEQALEEALEKAVADFNESDMVQYADDIPGLVSLKMTQAGRLVGDQVKPIDSGGGAVGVMVEAEFDKPPGDDQVKELLRWLEGQMSDGWGEGFEQETAYEDDVFDYSLHFYAGSRSYPKREVEIAGRSPTDSQVVAGVKAVGKKFSSAAQRFGSRLGKTRLGRAAKAAGTGLKNAGAALRGESVETPEALVDRLLNDDCGDPECPTAEVEASKPKLPRPGGANLKKLTPEEEAEHAPGLTHESSPKAVVEMLVEGDGQPGYDVPPDEEPAPAGREPLAPEAPAVPGPASAGNEVTPELVAHFKSLPKDQLSAAVDEWFDSLPPEVLSARVSELMNLLKSPQATEESAASHVASLLEKD